MKKRLTIDAIIDSIEPFVTQKTQKLRCQGQNGRSAIVITEKINREVCTKKAIGGEIKNFTADMHYDIMEEGEEYQTEKWQTAIVCLGNFGESSVDEEMQWLRFVYPPIVGADEVLQKLRNNHSWREKLIEEILNGQSIYLNLLRSTRAPAISPLTYKNKDGEVKLN